MLSKFFPSILAVLNISVETAMMAYCSLLEHLEASAQDSGRGEVLFIT